jgi:hypothetical protein
LITTRKTVDEPKWPEPESNRLPAAYDLGIDKECRCRPPPQILLSLIPTWTKSTNFRVEKTKQKRVNRQRVLFSIYIKSIQI